VKGRRKEKEGESVVAGKGVLDDEGINGATTLQKRRRGRERERERRGRR
jgi:hypothetical protein